MTNANSNQVQHQRRPHLLNISYREFSNSLARSAFNNDVEYDLSVSNIIDYNGASVEIIDADNSGITYKLLKNFP